MAGYGGGLRHLSARGRRSVRRTVRSSLWHRQERSLAERGSRGGDLRLSARQRRQAGGRERGSVAPMSTAGHGHRQRVCQEALSLAPRLFLL